MATLPTICFPGDFANEFDRFLSEIGLVSGHVVAKQHLGRVDTIELSTTFTCPKGTSATAQEFGSPPFTRISDFGPLAMIRLHEMLEPLKMPYARLEFDVARQMLRTTIVGEKLRRDDLDRLKRYWIDP